MSFYFYLLKETLYRWILIIAAKIILAISPVLWKTHNRLAFKLHQRLGRWVIRQHHKHNLNVL